MNSIKLFCWLAAGVVSGVLMSAPAYAWDFGSRRADVRHDRIGLRNHRRDLIRDRRELRDHFRRGGAASEIAQERAEIRQDWRALGQDRREFWRDRHWGGNWGRWDGDWGRDDNYRYRPYRRGWYDRFGWWRPYWR